MGIKTTVITNDDGTTGYITNANKYLLSDDYLKKFELLKKLSLKPSKTVSTVKAGGVTESSKEIAPTNTPSYLGFLTKMLKFHFAPPSDNLWTIEIDTRDKVLNNNGNGLVSLYNAIIAANSAWKQISPTKWEIKLDNTKRHLTGQQYIQLFVSSSGIFLAQNINFTPHSVQINESVFPLGMQHSGFLNFGFVAQNRQINRTLKISFLVSNWDIGDILFDPWIAAIAQRGTIETEDTSLKARIIIKEYSSGVPKEYNNDIVPRQMLCRKQYIFENCVPVNRGSVLKNYNFNDAGTFKTSIVEFKFDDYKIEYFI